MEMVEQLMRIIERFLPGFMLKFHLAVILSHLFSSEDAQNPSNPFPLCHIMSYPTQPSYSLQPPENERVFLSKKENWGQAGDCNLSKQTGRNPIQLLRLMHLDLDLSSFSNPSPPFKLAPLPASQNLKIPSCEPIIRNPSHSNATPKCTQHQESPYPLPLPFLPSSYSEPAWFFH